MKKKLFLIAVITVILSGAALRFANLRYGTQFNWDQEYLAAYPARDIAVNRHFTLIGGKASSADIYLGPLYSYLSAAVYLIFGMDPVSGGVLAAVFSVLFMTTAYFLLAKIFSQKTALIFLLLWCTSPYILSFERIPWNVNMLPLSSILVFSGLLLMQKRESVPGFFICGLGFFLGFNSHFTVLFFLPASFFILWKLKSAGLRKILVTVSGILLSVLPVFIFEIRHNFPMLRAMKYSGGEGVTLQNFLQHAFLVFRLIPETAGKILFYDGSLQFLILFSAILFFGIHRLRKTKKYAVELKLAAAVIFTYLIGFIVYQGPVPDYYLIGLFPVFVLVSTFLTVELSEKYPAFLNIFIIFLIYSFAVSAAHVFSENPNSLGNKQDIVRKIKETAGEKTVSINYDMPLEWSNGYGYLLDYYGVNRSDLEHADLSFWISYPGDRFPGGTADFCSGKISLGYPETVRMIRTSKDVVLADGSLALRVPEAWMTAYCPPEKGNPHDTVILTPQQEVNCNLTKTDTFAGIKITLMSSCRGYLKAEVPITGFNPALEFYRPEQFSGSQDKGDRDTYMVAMDKNTCVLFETVADASVTRGDISLILKSAHKNEKN